MLSSSLMRRAPGTGKKCGDPSHSTGPGLKTNGDPCPNYTVVGTERCAIHSTTAPQAKVKAERLLAFLRMPAVEALYKVLDALMDLIQQHTDDAVCLTCGYPKNDAEGTDILLKACGKVAQTAAAVLDRTGMGPRHTLEVRQSDGLFDVQSLIPTEREELAEILANLKSLKDRVRTRMLAVPDELLNPTTSSVTH